MTENVVEKEQKSIIYKQQLDAIKGYIESDPPNSKMALLHIRLFTEQIPENTPLEKSCREMVDPIKDTYEREMKILRIQEETRRYLEASDAINRGIPMLRYQYATKLYYVLAVLYDRFNLYNERAITDYEL